MTTEVKKPTADMREFFFVPAEGEHWVLVGLVSGHERNDLNGRWVRTSNLLKVDFATMQAETRNTIYNLRSPNADWARGTRILAMNLFNNG